MDVRILRDALHNAHPDVTCPQASSLREREANVAYGRGVLVGLVTGLMSTGYSFDDAWQLLLAQSLPLQPDCVPPTWPTLVDYVEAGKAEVRASHPACPECGRIQRLGFDPSVQLCSQCINGEVSVEEAEILDADAKSVHNRKKFGHA